ncbi:DUF1232 domain-containing protein [Paralcaligenes sp. KSB-10]|uniref:YkvA family protein n=1 Tax=Paralcaligenes sp. KSB-10 TaxID=2901142 RepID=UPI001E38A0F9|nr:YkvA family protein [Paralcaligenes sp. KSB-10]UHL63380.1 DUF1232 domain-containing protein [Paralcaligenes sp. KSB-10]
MPHNFWGRLSSYIKSSGKRALEKTLYLYYALQSPNTPLWAKGVIYIALGYFLLPLDLIPDFIPTIGYLDDLGVLTAAMYIIGRYITPEIRSVVRQKLEQQSSEAASDAENRQP